MKLLQTADSYSLTPLTVTTPAIPSSLTPATSTNLGGVKIGSGVSVTPDGTISVNPAPVVEQNLNSNSTSSVPSVYAVRFTTDSLQSQISSINNNAIYSLGTNAGSVVLRNNSNTASNYKAAVLAGESCNATGGYSTIVGGYIQTANANGGIILNGRNNTMNNAAGETWGIIAGSTYCTTNAVFSGIFNSNNCTIGASAANTSLIGCTNLNVTAGSNQTYLNNVLFVDPGSLYNVPSPVRSAVTGATYTNGEAASIVNSMLGMKFFDTNWRYEAMLASDGTTITWIRTVKA